MERYCTIPTIFGLRDWFETRFGDLCEEHDRRYIEREGTQRDADLAMCAGMVERGYPLLAGVTYWLFFRTIGWLWWHDWVK